MFKTLAPLVLLFAAELGLSACQGDPNIEARSAELANLPGIKVTISGADLGHDKVQAVARHLEGKATDTAAAMVRMKKDSQAGATLEVELYARSLPSADVLTADLKATFPELAAATISTAPATGAPAHEMPVIEVSDELSPEEAKKEIIEQLQAEGVDGAIDVQVQDNGEGRRIEVRVEKQEVH